MSLMEKGQCSARGTESSALATNSYLPGQQFISLIRGEVRHFFLPDTIFCLLQRCAGVEGSAYPMMEGK